MVGLKRSGSWPAGDLRDPRRAALPGVAAVAVLAALFLLANATGDAAARQGWGTRPPPRSRCPRPVLVVVSTHLLTASRTFLLTLAVVDGLFAITIIAVFHTSELHLTPLLLRWRHWLCSPSRAGGGSRPGGFRSARGWWCGRW